MLMPIVDTGEMAGSTTGIITESRLRSMPRGQRPGILLLRDAGLLRFAER
jgi:hypothetical protein